MKVKKAVTAALLFAILLTAGFSPAAASAGSFEALTYPDEALTAYDPTMTKRVSSGDDHVSNRGYANETGLFVSPCWLCSVDGGEVPVYAAMSYDYETDIGVPHSFAYLWVKAFGAGLHVTLRSLGDEVKSAAILPKSLATPCETDRGGVSFTVTKPGRYTCLINGDSQQDAVTLTVKAYTDEQAEIAAYRAQYGAEQVAVYPKGVYDIDAIDSAGKRVIYFCRGSFFRVPHHFDIRSETDAAQKPAVPDFFTLARRNGVTVTGFGTVDYTKVDRSERGLTFLSQCADLTVEGLLFLNPPGWTVTAYGCEGLTLRGIDVIGYRTNSDCINICGCRNVTVSDCFARNGDDCFSVKTTNTVYPAAHIRFEHCIAWSNKARCYGVTGEVESPISDVTFADSAVIYRGATWDNDRVCSLAVALETGGAPIDGVTFENIEIHRDSGRPFEVIVYHNGLQNCSVRGIVFRNITASGGLPAKLAAKRSLTGSERIRCVLFRVCAPFLGSRAQDSLAGLLPNGNRVDVTFENVVINGKRLNRFNAPTLLKTTGSEQILFF